MRLAGCLKCFAFLTVVGLVYIHMQMQIFDLAYKGKKKEVRIQRLMEDRGALNHMVLTLKSANHLGSKLLDNSAETLQFFGHDRVMTLTGRAPVVKVVIPPQSRRADHPLVNFLSWVTFQEEARAWAHPR